MDENVRISFSEISLPMSRVRTGNCGIEMVHRACLGVSLFPGLLLNANQRHACMGGNRSSGWKIWILAANHIITYWYWYHHRHRKESQVGTSSK